jgi:cystine transport system ATP-binding protein
MIELSNIEKRFGDAVILKDISIRIPEGSVTALVGPSGGGKSTLLRCINLLEIPTAGEIRIGEEKLTFAPGQKTKWQAIQKIRRQTGMVFQNFQLFPHQSAIDNVMEGLVTVLRWPKEKARSRAMELLTKVGMAHKADAWPATLSGGQQQRVAIARALARLANEGTTMVMATHDLRLASKIANDVVFLEAGSVVETGSAKNIFTAPERERTKRFISTINAAHTYDI